MKLTCKKEAYEFLKEAQKQRKVLTEEEKKEINNFFTETELQDLSFIKININNCFSHSH
jgi:hypothetical protein